MNQGNNRHSKSVLITEAVRMSRLVTGPLVSETSIAGAAFNRIAPQYDELWTYSSVGRLQRDTVWRRLDKLFNDGETLLDLGCGTGEDALHFMRRGMSVRPLTLHPRW